MKRATSVTHFAVATAAVSAAAWLATYNGRWPAFQRLQYSIFQRLFVFTDDWAAALEVALVLLVWWVPSLRRVGARLALFMGAHPRRVSLATFVVLALSARFAYLAHPYSMDESTQLAQAVAFSQGKLTWILPVDLLDRLVPAGFRNYFVAVNEANGEAASLYQPGFSLLLTPFVRAGVPWLLNPAIGAIAVLLVHSLARKLQNREAAGWATLFTVASPMFTVNCISFYSMPALLALNLSFVLLLLDMRTSRAYLAGVVGGFALILHRSVPHVAFALPWVLWLIGRRRWRSLGALGLGYIPIGLTIGRAWPLLTASIAQVPLAGPAGAVAVVSEVLLPANIMRTLHLPDYQSVVIHLDETWKLWIWSAPGLMILFLMGLRHARGPVWTLVASFAVTYAGYWLVPASQGHGWGYRYMLPAWAAVPIVAAIFVARRPGHSDTMIWEGWAGGLALASLVLATSYWFVTVHWVIAEHVSQRIPTPATGRWIVFLRPKDKLYGWDLVQNMPRESRDLVMMSFGAEADARLMASRFPGATQTLADSRGSLWRLQN